MPIAKKKHNMGKKMNKTNFTNLEKIQFSKINRQAQSFIRHVEYHFECIAQILLHYESFEVVQDEVNRSLDLLKNLKENKKYFSYRVGAISTFLPKNQPLYALTCFVIVPSLMAEEVHFRIPHSMRDFFPDLERALNLRKFFPNVFISKKQRLPFLIERSCVKYNPKTQESYPVTDAVIFTGTPTHAEKLRLVFDKRTLFIANGAGHNPVVVTENANIDEAISAVLTLQMYNQGQDCAAPNTVLVNKKIFSVFRSKLSLEIKNIKVGKYIDRSCRVGPISEPEDIIRIASLLIENRNFLDPSTRGIINLLDGIVEPTIISKPLKNGGNFTEVFAPIIFLQMYEDDSDLSLYFESPHYPRNAMYVTCYGQSNYVNNLVKMSADGKILHDHTTLIYNTHLHASGVERGVKPYGGYGYGSSSISFNGKIICKPTFPQRDIFENLARPLGNKKKRDELRSIIKSAFKTEYRDVSKLLGLKITESDLSKDHLQLSEVFYADSHSINKKGYRYISLKSENIYSLLERPNSIYLASLHKSDLLPIRKLKYFLKKNRHISLNEFTTWLYMVSHNPSLGKQSNRMRQLCFFQNVYQLLLGRESGPRLAQFLLDVDPEHLDKLLDV